MVPDQVLVPVRDGGGEELDELDGEIRKYKLYDHNMVDKFDGPTPVLIHPDLPFIIPIGFLARCRISRYM